MGTIDQDRTSSKNTKSSCGPPTTGNANLDPQSGVINHLVHGDGHREVPAAFEPTRKGKIWQAWRLSAAAAPCPERQAPESRGDSRHPAERLAAHHGSERAKHLFLRIKPSIPELSLLATRKVMKPDPFGVKSFMGSRRTLAPPQPMNCISRSHEVVTLRIPLVWLKTARGLSTTHRLPWQAPH